MTYGGMKVKPTTKFGEWLNTQMRMHDMSTLEVANKLHCNYSTICHHRVGRQLPTFSDVVAYCWAFGCTDDPETVWKMVKVLIEEK